MVPRRVSCVGRRRLGGVSRGIVANVFALIGGCYFVSSKSLKSEPQEIVGDK